MGPGTTPTQLPPTGGQIHNDYLAINITIFKLPFKSSSQNVYMGVSTNNKIGYQIINGRVLNGMVSLIPYLWCHLDHKNVEQ